MNTQISWGQTAIVPKLYFTARNVTSGATGWTITAVTNNAATDYWKLLSTGNTMTSPSMDFSVFSNINIALSLQSFGTIVSNSDKIKIEYYDGATWTQVGSLLATTGTKGTQTVSLPYSYSAAQIRVTAPNATSTAGARVYSIDITGNAVSSGPEINIKGNAVSIVDGATPVSATNGTDFGTVATSTNITKTYTIENTGSANLTVSAISLTNGTAHSIGGITLPATITSGTETTFTVTFNSSSAGTFNDVVNLVSDDSDESTYNFDIKAIAETPVPNISVKGNSAIIAVGDTTPSATDDTNFGNTATNTNVVRTYTIENTGTGDLIVNDILMLNSPTSKYNVNGISLPATIAAGGSTTFTVTFNSLVAGTFADSVLIDNNDPTDSTYDFAVSAKAVTLNFGVGDISITALANDTPDGISFVNWVPIPVDAELYFTDNAYEAGALKTNEGGSLLWKNNTGNIIPVGTVIYISTLTTASTDLGIVTGALDGLSASGENLFIYEGSAVSPSFIYGLSNLAWITTGATTSNNSYLPAELNVTSGNIVIGDFDNVEYSGALAPKDVKSSFTAYKTLVNDPANWTKNNTYFALNSIDFELAAVWESAAWTDGLTPTSLLKTVVNDTYSTTANGPFTAKKLTVTSLGSLTINTGTNVTVQNEVINSGSLVVENNANLIQVNNATNTGAITVNRNSSPLKRLDYTLWSSPVSGTQTLAGFSPLTSQSPSRFYTFNTTYNTGGVNGAYAFIASPTTTTFAEGAGYLIRMPNTADAVTATAYAGQFTGEPNNGDIPVSLIDGAAAGLRFNLVGNPYPSTISMQKFVFDNNTANIENTLWFWRKTNGAGTAYCTWQAGALVTDPGTFVTNGNAQSVNPMGIIQTAQGFFVEAKSGATSLTFKNSQRIANNSNQFFKTKQAAEASKIWLNATNVAGDFSQMAVTYFDKATVGLDAFDGKYINDSAFALTSYVDNGEYTIQGRPAFDVSDVVALNFKTNSAGDYTIAIDHSEGIFASGQDIYLVDNTNGTETNLRTSSYNFTAAAGTDNTRFSLKYQKTLKVDAPVFDDNSISVYNNNGALYVNSKSAAISNIKVFDVQGRLLAEQKNVKSTTSTINNLRANHQVLIVKITSEDNKEITKKLLN
ncbi:MAG TPA: choice-of-anchor D domain-containing protein [Flavobacterium sp.]|nr:choice-of-anchor D domain-containing protein [Flavobacterium sp.]